MKKLPKRIIDESVLSHWRGQWQKLWFYLVVSVFKGGSYDEWQKTRRSGLSY